MNAKKVDFTVEIKDKEGLVVTMGIVIGKSVTWKGSLKAVYEIILLEKLAEDNRHSKIAALHNEVARLNGLLTGRLHE
jgi:hypothetical protein